MFDFFCGPNHYPQLIARIAVFVMCVGRGGISDSGAPERRDRGVPERYMEHRVNDNTKCMEIYIDSRSDRLGPISACFYTALVYGTELDEKIRGRDVGYGLLDHEIMDRFYNWAHRPI